MTTQILVIMLASLIFVDTIHFGLAQASTNEKGIIDSDTIWAKENSPYTLTGTMLVNKGVTLTIDPGVIVNLNSYSIQVNGTLYARGSNNDRIQFNDGEITFLYSTAWKEQENSGTIIENANLNSVHIDIRSSSVKINDNMINDGLIQSHIQASDVDTSLYLTHEKFETAIISNNYIVGGSSSSIIEALNTDIVSNNTIICTQKQRIGINAQYYSSVTSNTITGMRGYGIIGGRNISANVISGFEVGIEVGYATVMNNLVFNNTYGIEVGGAGSIVQNNTIANNAVGVYSAQGYFNYNNFENNSEYNIYLEFSKSNVDATNNWWGTADSAVIDQKIWDFNDDFNLGKVNYTPFLTAANSQTMPDANAPTPNQSTSPTQNPTTPPDHPDAQAGVLFGLDWEQVAIVVLGVVVVLLVVVVVLQRKSRGVVP